MLIDITGVEWGIFVDVLNAAKGAGVQKIVKPAPKKSTGPPPAKKPAA
jgi:hypothetical protein